MGRLSRPRLYARRPPCPQPATLGHDGAFELEALPGGLLLDGELISWGEDGLPSFPLLGERMLFRAHGIGVTYLIFDLLAVDGDSTMRLPYRRRRQLLDELNLSGPAWHTPPAWEDGEALWNVVCERGLEGVVAKKRLEPYRPGERLWTKVKNRDYWRYPVEVEAARRQRASGQRVYDGHAAGRSPVPRLG